MTPRPEGALMRVRVAALLLMVGLVAPSRLPRGRVALAVAAALAFSLATSIGPLDSTPRAVAANPAATVIAKYRARIPELMAEQGVPGLAVALVDRDRTLWVEGFGHVDGGGSAPVTADTIFSVQSMSKLFTATAVMQAVAAGRARPRRADHDLPARVHRPQRVREAPGTEDHASDAPQPHRRLHARGAGGKQQRPRPRRRSTRTCAASPTPGCASRWAVATPTPIWGSTSPATSWSASRVSRSQRSCATPCSSRWAWTAAPSTGPRSARPPTAPSGTCTRTRSRRSTCR